MINFVGVSMETDIRPVIWLAEFLKTKKILYDAIKWPDFACVVYFSQFSTKKLIFLMKKMGLHAGKHYIILSICTNILTNFVFKQSQQNNGNDKSFKQSQQNNANGELLIELQWPMNCSII